jgi:hypothetical protein
VRKVVVSNGDLGELLARIEVPGEDEARERAWRVVRAAFAEREPAPRRRRSLRPLVALVPVLALVGGALSPPGQAVVQSVREAIGSERAAPSLFSLPAGGRLLVTSDSGPWIVRADGSKRWLGRGSDASWSPFGRFVAVARPNELAALEPDGDARWTLGRPRVRLPSWGGTRTDTRIAYLSGSELRVVAGDGTGDRPLASSALQVPAAWRPGRRHVLAFSDRAGRIHVVSADRRDRVGTSAPGEPPLRLAWSRDGRRLYALSPRSLRVLDGRARLVGQTRAPAGARHVALAVSPGGRDVALVRRVAGRSEVVLAGRRLFAGAGEFTDLTWSPDGRWLLIAWKDADQWLFLRARGRRKLEATSAVTEQFDSSRFPNVGGWCCEDS